MLQYRNGDKIHRHTYTRISIYSNNNNNKYIYELKNARVHFVRQSISCAGRNRVKF